MNVALQVALNQQMARYPGVSSPAQEPAKIYAGIYNKQLLTKEGKVITGTKEAWRDYFKYAKLVEITTEITGQARING